MKKIALISIVALLALGFLCLRIFSVKTIRPLEVFVVDAETNLPLSDVSVYYKLETFRPKNLISQEYVPFEFRHLYTDTEGRVEFPGHRIILLPLNDVHQEEFWINIDSFDNRRPAEFASLNVIDSIKCAAIRDPSSLFHGDLIWNPKGDYRGAVLVNWGLAENKVSKITMGGVDFIISKSSLKQRKDSIVIKLRRK